MPWAFPTFLRKALYFSRYNMYYYTQVKPLPSAFSWHAHTVGEWKVLQKAIWHKISGRKSWRLDRAASFEAKWLFAISCTTLKFVAHFLAIITSEIHFRKQLFIGVIAVALKSSTQFIWDVLAKMQPSAWFRSDNLCGNFSSNLWIPPYSKAALAATEEPSHVRKTAWVVTLRNVERTGSGAIKIKAVANHKIELETWNFHWIKFVQHRHLSSALCIVKSNQNSGHFSTIISLQYWRARRDELDLARRTNFSTKQILEHTDVVDATEVSKWRATCVLEVKQCGCHFCLSARWRRKV